MSASRVVVIVSADGEWDVIHRIYPNADYRKSPYGEWFKAQVNGEQTVFIHGGWGKVPSAASTQYAIDTWSPELIVNLGTCGGFKGEVDRFNVVLADRTVIYDIHSQMSNPEIRQFCPLTPQGKKLLTEAMDLYQLSARAYFRILKVGRTIADLAGAKDIAKTHIQEALQYRSRKLFDS